MFKEYFLAFVLLTLCMAAVEAILFVPMASISNGHLPSANQVTVGLLISEFLANLWVATQVAAFLLATAYIVDWLAPPDFKVATRFAQMTAGATLGALFVTIIAVMQLMSVTLSKAAVSSNAVFVIFVYAIPAALTVAALAPHIFARIWKVRLGVDRLIRLSPATWAKSRASSISWWRHPKIRKSIQPYAACYPCLRTKDKGSFTPGYQIR
jgi:hypothetical protein